MRGSALRFRPAAEERGHVEIVGVDIAGDARDVAGHLGNNAVRAALRGVRRPATGDGHCATTARGRDGMLSLPFLWKISRLLLGETARRSYSLMHGAILGAQPPLLYWLPATVAVIQACAQLRRRGVGAWETVDAGPQVKILCSRGDAGEVTRCVKEDVPGAETVECFPGPGLQAIEASADITRGTERTP